MSTQTSLHSVPEPMAEVEPIRDLHAVQFYDHDPFLIDRVASFVVEGLEAGEAAVVIATLEHQESLVERIRALGIDVDAQLASARLQIRDARQVLREISQDDLPRWELFSPKVAALIRKGLAVSPRVRVFGEVVNLMVAAGDGEAAILLERYWTRLAETVPFSLLCAYAMGSFANPAQSEHFPELCQAHTRVAPTESYSRAVASADPPELAVHGAGGGAPPDHVRQDLLLEEALRASLAERNRLLAMEQEARSKAEAASRVKDELLALLSHELRNPLAPIKTSLELMRMRFPHLACREVEVIERQVAHLTRLLDDLLDVSRFIRGTVELKRERLAVSEVLGEAVRQVGPLLQRRLHHLSVEITPPALEMDADRGRLVQVLTNLLSNAAKYTEPGGRISVVAQKRGPRVRLTVKDTGKGMSGETLGTLFNLFSQEAQKPDRAAGGLGLGLAIVKALTDLHGGTVEAHSDGVGLGSELVVELPDRVDRLQVVPTPASFSEELRTSNPLRILIVDDNEDAADMLAEYLQVLGHQTRVTHDGPSALGLVADFLPQVALVDLGLPVMDGFELARELRTLVPDCRLVAVSGYGQDSDRLRSREAGFEHHLVKPVSLDTIRTLLEPGGVVLN